MAQITVAFKNPKHGKIRATIIQGKLWYKAKDICRVLGFPIETPIAALVSLKNQTEHLTFDDGYHITARTVLVDSSGVHEILEASRSSTSKAVKNWFDFHILPKSERLSEQLEKINEDYCTIHINIEG